MKKYRMILTIFLAILILDFTIIGIIGLYNNVPYLSYFTMVGFIVTLIISMIINSKLKNL